MTSKRNTPSMEQQQFVAVELSKLEKINDLFFKEPTMTAEEFCSFQDSTGMNKRQLCRLLCVGEKRIAEFKSGKKDIPSGVVKLMQVYKIYHD